MKTYLAVLAAILSAVLLIWLGISGWDFFDRRADLQETASTISIIPGEEQSIKALEKKQLELETVKLRYDKGAVIFQYAIVSNFFFFALFGLAWSIANDRRRRTPQPERQ